MNLKEIEETITYIDNQLRESSERPLPGVAERFYCRARQQYLFMKDEALNDAKIRQGVPYNSEWLLENLNT